MRRASRDRTHSKHPAKPGKLQRPHPRKDLAFGTARGIMRDAGLLEKDQQMHYVALIHKDPDSAYGVSFPDLHSCCSAGDTLDEATG